MLGTTTPHGDRGIRSLPFECVYDQSSHECSRVAKCRIKVYSGIELGVRNTPW